MSTQPDVRRQRIWDAWSSGSVLMLADLPPSIADFIAKLLEPAGVLTWGEPVIPEGHGYIYAQVCLPLLTTDASHFGYIGSRSSRKDFRTYPGSSTHEDCIASLDTYPPDEWVRICLGIYPCKNLARMEKMAQRALGIRKEWKDPEHLSWWNKIVFGGNYYALTQDSTLQRQKIVRWNNSPEGRAHLARLHADPQHREWSAKSGRLTGPAAARRMTDRRRSLTHDPHFWDWLSLPLNQRPERWFAQRNASRYGFDIPDDAVVVPVSRPTDQGRGRKPGWCPDNKMCRVLLTLYARGAPPSFAEHKTDLRAEFSAPDRYGSTTSAKAGITRDCRKGLFALVCPDTGRVILGPGSDDDHLTWSRETGWRRGRVRSLGPYGWANPPPGLF